ncbi:Conserved hypothetical, protein [Geosmithia morbida]|uniref:Conserved hypothetical, protein n=1 Tax=Geosmithia morbida TaxID=1094350 RepID=A0A9P5CXI5_9HYPO|nr:Conserved hypothetical, protein [Geosmithia morbida]KAF4119313.1 Conserved hypothetical, protein [Geosmithia morbida]
MVSTRSSSSRADDAKTPSPTASSTQLSRGGASSSTAPKNGSSSSSSKTWHHVPDNLTLIWLAVSLPLVTWDTLYIFGRPATMPGGSLHWPLWSPYALYGEVDHVYGWEAFNSQDGFTAAQGFLNIVETAMYLYYLVSVYGRGGWKVEGEAAARTVLIGFAAAVMTLSKTALYWLQEYFGNYSHIGHNTAADIILLWVIPNGAWLIGPSYMIRSFARDVIRGITAQDTKAE